MSAIKPGTNILGRFEVLKQYHGGSFRVFFAIDRQEDRAVVLKFLPSDNNDPDAQKKLLKEASMLSKVQGENVLEVYNCYLIDTGEIFISMEWAPGGDLAEYLKKHGPLTWEQARKLLDKILEGLEKIHSHNIIHRDIKPANILFADKNTPMVADFGISKAVSNTIEKMTKKTSIIGTPEYMAPETIRGDKLGYATDIYSIGILAWEMLTQTTPFLGENNNVVTLMYRQLNQEPDYSQVPQEAREWIKICLEKDFDKRINSVKELRILLFNNKLKKTTKKASKPTQTTDFSGIFEIKKPQKRNTSILNIDNILEKTGTFNSLDNEQIKDETPPIKPAIKSEYAALINKIDNSKVSISPRRTTRYDITPRLKSISNDEPLVQQSPIAEKKIHYAKSYTEEILPHRKPFSKKDFIFFAIIGLIILSASSLLLTRFFKQKTFRVALDGTADHIKIQEAIYSAGEGDTIKVAPGRYNESIVIDDPKHDGFVLIAEDSSKTSLLSKNIPTIRMKNGTNAIISGFEVKYAGNIQNSSIDIDNSSLRLSNCILSEENNSGKPSKDSTKKPGIAVKGNNAYLEIKNCAISGKNLGINIFSKAKADIENNSFTYNANAIKVTGDSTFAMISDNTIRINDIGIHVSENARAEITGNTIQRNKIGIMEYDIFWDNNPLFGYIRLDSLVFGQISEIDSNTIQGNLQERLLVNSLNIEICPQCGYRFYSKHKFAACPRCYYDFELHKKRCPDCNTLNPPDALGCKNCPFEFAY